MSDGDVDMDRPRVFGASSGSRGGRGSRIGVGNRRSRAGFPFDSNGMAKAVSNRCEQPRSRGRDLAPLDAPRPRCLFRYVQFRNCARGQETSPQRPLAGLPDVPTYAPAEAARGTRQPAEVARPRVAGDRRARRSAEAPPSAQRSPFESPAAPAASACLGRRASVAGVAGAPAVEKALDAFRDLAAEVLDRKPQRGEPP
jgi:hypothetical protein